jgi:hypothetical protein
MASLGRCPSSWGSRLTMVKQIRLHILTSQLSSIRELVCSKQFSLPVLCRNKFFQTFSICFVRLFFKCLPDRDFLSVAITVGCLVKLPSIPSLGRQNFCTAASAEFHVLITELCESSEKNSLSPHCVLMFYKQC